MSGNLSEINVFAVARQREIKIVTVLPQNQHFLRLHAAKDQYFAGFQVKLPSFRSRADETTNTGFFAYVISRKRRKLQQKNIQNIV